MIDECRDRDFEVFGEEVVFKQDAVLERPVPALDLALAIEPSMVCYSGDLAAEAARFSNPAGVHGSGTAGLLEAFRLALSSR